MREPGPPRPRVGDELTADQDAARRKALTNEILGQHSRILGATTPQAEKRLKERISGIKRPLLATKIISQYIKWLKEDVGIQGTAKAA